VQCFAKRHGDGGYSGEISEAKPKALQKIEKESASGFYKEFSLNHKSAADIFRNLLQHAEVWE